MPRGRRGAQLDSQHAGRVRRVRRGRDKFHQGSKTTRTLLNGSGGLPYKISWKSQVKVVLFLLVKLLNVLYLKGNSNIFVSGVLTELVGSCITVS